MSELTVKAHRHIINPDGISPRTKAKTIALARLKTKSDYSRDYKAQRFFSEQSERGFSSGDVASCKATGGGRAGAESLLSSTKP